MARLLPLVAIHPEPPINAPLHTPNAVEAHGAVPDSRPLRVALLGYRSAPFSGGQGVYLRYLSQALMQLGHQVTVISGPPYPQQRGLAPFLRDDPIYHSAVRSPYLPRGDLQRSATS